MRDELLVRDVMTRDVVTLYENEDLLLAEHVMRLGRIRHLPVVRGHALVGLVTHRDLLRASISTLAGMTPQQDASMKRAIAVPDVMQAKVTTIGPGEPASRAARLMLERKLGCLPVVEEDGRLVGIVTEADFVGLALRWLEERPRAS